MLHPLDRKLLRDLRHLWGQVVAIALVVACGIACFVLALSAYQSLALTQQTYYDRYQFAHVFAEMTRAPQRLEAQIAGIPGVQQVQTRVVADVTLDVPGLAEPATGRLISVPPVRGSGTESSGQPMLNRVFLRQGRYPDPQRGEEILASEAFAEANGLALGDRIGAILNGRWQSLQIVGLALSPEYIYEIRGAGDLYPDNRRFGVLWMGEAALSTAFNLEGAFNSVALTVIPGTNEQAVITQLDRLTDPFGGRGAYSRENQVSHRIISDEIQSLEVTATLIPTMFLGIAAFLLHVVLSRLISTQREQIAVLKAFGYSNGGIGLHYLKLVLVVVAVGSLAGLGLGMWLGRGLTHLYADFFRFPLLVYRASPQVLISALLVSGGAALVGGGLAVQRAIRLPPAEAMRPEPPASFRPTLVERLGWQRLFSPTGRIILRNLERRPIQAGLSIIGIAFAAALLLMGLFFRDAVTYMMSVQFFQVQREDVTVIFNEPRPARTRFELAQLPGVLQAEGFRVVPAQLRHGQYSHRLGLTGLPQGGQLRRLLDSNLRPQTVPLEGVLLTDQLAEMLHIQPGEWLQVEVLEGSRPQRQVQVMGVVDEFLGLSAYMELGSLNRLMREGETLSGAYLSIDAAQAQTLYDRLKTLPAVAGVSFRETLLQSFEEISARNILVMTGILSLFAAVITFSVVYNSARIALSERSRELASLRIIGFSRHEISVILLGEQSLLVLAGIPVGWLLGFGLSASLAKAYVSELYRIPLVIHRSTYATVGLVVLVAAVVSGILIRRQLNRLDLIAVLKTRD
ncbi:ABC transporter permease [Thermostichus vulcanus]|uniref:ABC transporter permease n=1 Tax=Thermostichus vulcanus TaxID=32053 RepID=UPI001FCB0E0F|nr:ABC transporter permease [Thermostichus vulcanus]